MDAGPDGFRKKLRIWKWFWEHRNLVEEADVIHCHDVFFWYLPLRFFYPDKPVFTTFHGYESYPIKKKAILVRKISEKLSWGNICVGDFIKKWYGTKPTYVTYGAVEISNFKFPISNKFKKESAIFFGRLDDQTSVLTYIKAYEILKKKYPKFEFLVVGDGKYKNLISKKVKVIPFQKNPEKLLHKYHFVFVSRYLSILEAMAAKRLVIAAYDDPVKEDYLKMSPFARFISTEKTPHEIAGKISYVITNPGSEKNKVDTAYEWVMKQSWERMANNYLELWKNFKTT